jgi:uncharacterized Fe-S radical SAM superfamily protein PflX
MSQYTPLNVEIMAELNRKLKPIEYKIVLKEMENLGIVNGFVQDLNSSTTEYIPPFKY